MKKQPDTPCYTKKDLEDILHSIKVLNSWVELNKILYRTEGELWQGYQKSSKKLIKKTQDLLDHYDNNI